MPPGAGPPRPGRRRRRSAVRSGGCQVALVTLPEEMPINETIEAAYQLEDKVGIALGPVIVNGCYPPRAGLTVPAGQAAEAAGVTLDPELVSALDRARTFRLTRQELQEDQLGRLARELPLPQLRVPFLFTASIGPPKLDALSGALEAGIGALHDTSGVHS